MIGSLLLLAASATDWGVSALVERDHIHDWVALNEAPPLWWDRNSVAERQFNEVIYPIVLIRADASASDGLNKRLDALVAVDCDQNTIATFDLFSQDTGSGQNVRETPKSLNFSSLPDSRAEETQAMMRAVCGAGWTL